MRNDTRQAFNRYASHIAQLNGVDKATEKFAVAPTVAQTLEERIAESAAFLQEINVVPVDDQSAEKLGLGSSGTVAGRTDTSVNEREPQDLTSMDDNSYACKQTNFDTFMKYPTLDAWSKFKDFQTRMRNQVTLQVARDRLMIGWNGTSAATATDRVANPLLQDVNIGWLHHIRTHAPERVLTGTKIGNQDGNNYVNFDAAVFDACNELLADWYADDPEIVVIVGRSLVSDKYLSLVNSTEVPTEHEALKTMLLSRTMGGRRAELVPFFPSASLLITKKSNLSIYWQNGTHRRHIIDNPKRDRVEDYLSVNEAYVVEDFGACALLDGILQPDGAGGWA